MVPVWDRPLDDGSAKRHYGMVTRRLKPLLDGLTTLALLTASGLVIWRLWPPPPILLEDPVPVTEMRLHGSAPEDAPIITIFTDYECPYCRQLSQGVEPGIEKDWVATGRARLAIRHLPLDRIHPRARQASWAVECASRRGKGLEMHRALFAATEKLDLNVLSAAAVGVGLDRAEFEVCLQDPEVHARVDQDVAAARELGIAGTPTIMVGHAEGVRLRHSSLLKGAVTGDKLDSVLEQAGRATFPTKSLVIFGVLILVLVGGCGRWYLNRKRMVPQLS